MAVSTGTRSTGGPGSFLPGRMWRRAWVASGVWPRAARGAAVCGSGGQPPPPDQYDLGNAKAELVAPFVFDGSRDAEVVDTCFENVLLPALPKGSVIVLDDASFRKSPARKNWWPTPVVNCSSSPLTRPISTPSNTFGPSSKRPCAASCPTPKTQPFQFPICVNVMLVSYTVRSEGCVRAIRLRHLG